MVKKSFLFWIGLFCCYLSIIAQQNERRPFYEIGIYDGSGFRMTNLVRDTLIFQNDTIVIDESPLLEVDDLPSMLFIKDETFSESVKVSGFSTGLQVHSADRGYVARWQIWNGKLYLSDIHTHVMGSIPEIGRKAFRKRAERALGKRFRRSNRIFAEWFSGTLLGGIGGERNRYGIAGNFDRRATIRVENGVVHSVDIRNTGEKHPDFFEYRLFPTERPDRLPYYYYRIYRNGVMATNLHRDSLFYGTDTVHINESPLLGLNDIGLRFRPATDSFYEKYGGENHLDRGYRANWVIDCGRLYLADIRLFVPLGFGQDDYDIYKAQFLGNLERASGGTFAGGKLFACWFTGRIVGGIGGTPGRRDSYGIVGNFKREAIITVKNGVVENIEIKPVEHRESRLLQYRLPDE